MLTEEEYKKEWLAGQHQSDYNNCRFSDDKIQYAKEWLLNKQNTTSFDTVKDIIDVICQQKIKIIEDQDYCDKCQMWADKRIAQTLLYNKGLESYTIKTHVILPENGIITEDQVKDALNKFEEQVIFFKCNHGSGWNLRIDKSKSPVIKYIVDKLNEWLFLNYAYISGYEKQYEKIVPTVLVQPELVYQPLDYGFWCVDGEIKGISITKKYGKNYEEYFAFVDENGKANPWYIGLTPEWDNLPKSFMNKVEQMKPFVKDLAKEFKFVRLDMYYINDHVYFGETTFTPCSGLLNIRYR